MIEKIIAYYCAPALAGIKPANIVSCSKAKIKNIHNCIKILNNQLNPKDIYADILCECENRVLVMVYRKKQLYSCLKCRDVSEFLLRYGYKTSFTLQEYLSALKERIAHCREFPHEIGAFLGYPVCDICAFINHKNDGCILTGEWKVYSNAENAQKLFNRYKCCRKAVLKKVASGQTLAHIF